MPVGRSANNQPQCQTLVDALRRTFASDVERPALIFLDNGEFEGARLTAGDIDRRARAIAVTLLESGRPGDRALLLYPSGPDFVCAYVGCLFAGVVPVPCSLPSRQRTDPRVAAVAADAGVRWVLTSEPLFSARDRCTENHPVLQAATWISTPEVDDARAADWFRPDVDGETLALLQYTSGSTSTPRGVMVTHQNLLTNLHDLTVPWPYDADSVMVTWLPLFHDLGLIYGLLRPLVQGFLCVMMPPAAFLQRPARWLQAISRYRGTHTGGPNFAYDLCAARITAEEKASLDLRSWRVALNGAEPIHADTLQRFRDAFASCGLPATTMSPSYGLAEATLGVAMTPSSETSRVLHADAAAFARGVVSPAPAGPGAVRVVSCGPLATSVAARIVDPEMTQACAPDRIGEIWLRGAAIAKGYWGNEAATRETFQAHVATDDDGPYMRTGDLGFVHAGDLYVTGRCKDLIIIHGLNYYPHDVELTVEHSHPALAHTGAAAFAVDIAGEERVVVFAEIQRTHLKRCDAGQVFAAITSAVSQDYGITLHAIALLGPRMLPKTSSGKVRRARCREMFATGELAALAVWRAPAPTAAGQPAAALPASERDIREWLIDRCAQRLNLPRAAVDPRVSFAMFGMASVDAVGLSGDLEQWLQRPVSSTVFYDYPSIDALAAHVAGGRPIPSDACDPDSLARSADPAIAVVGLGCRLPGAAGPAALWRLLERGGDAIGAAPADRRSPDGFAGGFLDEVDRFDADFFGMSPREAERTDPQQRLLLEVAWEAIEDAGMAPGRLAGSRTGVFIGISNSDYGRLLAAQGAHQDLFFGTGSALSIAANRISYALDLRGPSLAVDTACSSSLVAVTLAVQSLRRGECDVALAGGVNLVLAPEYSIAFANARMLAADGRCKTFSSHADGYGRGEGAGVVVLKRLADAERSGDRILAVIRGVAVNQDGRTTGLTAPNGPAQQAVVRAALRDAGVAAAEVGYVEAHGTGTPLGDPIEVNALAGVLLEGRPPDAVCRIGSIKTNIGHLESAAGIAALIKTVQCLVHRRIPATLHCGELNPRLEIAGTPMRIATAGGKWDTAGPRIAGVSSFGFGGTNAHVVLQESIDAGAEAAGAGPAVLTLSARDRRALAEMAGLYAAALAGAPATRFADICFTTNVSRSDMPERLAVVAASAAEAAAALEAWHLDGGAVSAGVRVLRGRAAGAGIEVDWRDVAIEALAESWTNGGRINWEAVHAGHGRRKVSLPTYPFQRSRHWLPATVVPATSGDPGGTVAALTAQAPLGGRLYRVQWRAVDRADGGRANGEPQSWVVYADDGGAGDLLAGAFEAHGGDVLVVRRGAAFSLNRDGSVTVRPDDAKDYARVLAQVSQRFGGTTVGHVHLWSLDAAAVATPGAVMAALERGATSVVLLLQALIGARGGRLWMVTRLAQAVHERPSDAGLQQSPVWGIGKSLALEHPEHWGGLIDMGDDTPSAELCDELRSASRTIEPDDHVAFRASSRLVARVVRATEAPATPAFRRDAAYLITGGLGTLGLAVARRCAEGGARRLVLVSRQGAATSERQQAVAALEALGARVTTPAIDVTDTAALAQLCRELADQGTPIAGVVHAAGLAERVPLRSLSPAALRRVVAVKAVGALAVREATLGRPLDFLIVVSSIASAWGAAGLSSYVAANAFLDVFAHAGTTGVPTASVALGPVEDGMLPPDLLRSMKEIGVSAWTPARAADALLALAGGPHVVAADIDWARFAPVFEGRGRRPLLDEVRPAAVMPSSAAAGPTRSAVLAVSGVAREALLHAIVGEEAGAVLGLKAGESPDQDRGFFDLGMDSLMAIDLKQRLEAVVGEPLPPTLIFDYPNVAAVAAFLGRVLPHRSGRATQASARDAGPAPAGAPGPVDAAALESGLARLERLL